MSRDVAATFADIDAFNPDTFVAHLTPDARFRFGNAETITGRDWQIYIDLAPLYAWAGGRS